MSELVQRYTEPVLNSRNPKWLIVTKEYAPPNDDNRSIQDKIRNPIDPEIQTRFNTEEPNIWQCRKCEAQFRSDKKPDVCSKCNRASQFDQVTKSINMDRWKLPHWKDIPLEDINMMETYDNLVSLIKKCIIFPDEIQYELFTLWIIASYKKEAFNTAPFLIFRGLISSGKTRALDLIRELGYRMVHTTGVSFPAMCRLTHYHGAGVLIDEIDNKISKKFESGRQYLDFLKPSYRRGSTYTVADKENQEETFTYKNFGFKAFAGEKGGYDDAIFSRSIDFCMEKEYPEIPELMYVQDDINQLQTILLNYRYKFTEPELLPLDYPLKGRNREIFSPLIRTAQHIGVDHKRITNYINEREQDQIDDMQESKEYVLLTNIYRIQHGLTEDKNVTLDRVEREYIPYRELAELCGYEKSQTVGYVVKKTLQLKTKRLGKEGTCLLLNNEKNQKKLANLYRRYHVID